MTKRILIIATILTGISGNAFAVNCRYINKMNYMKECCIDGISYLLVDNYYAAGATVKIDPKTDKPQHCNY